MGTRTFQQFTPLCALLLTLPWEGNLEREGYLE